MLTCTLLGRDKLDFQAVIAGKRAQVRLDLMRLKREASHGVLWHFATLGHICPSTGSESTLLSCPGVSLEPARPHDVSRVQTVSVRSQVRLKIVALIPAQLEVFACAHNSALSYTRPNKATKKVQCCLSSAVPLIQGELCKDKLDV